MHTDAIPEVLYRSCSHYLPHRHQAEHCQAGAMPSATGISTLGILSFLCCDASGVVKNSLQSGVLSLSWSSFVKWFQANVDAHVISKSCKFCTWDSKVALHLGLESCSAILMPESLRHGHGMACKADELPRQQLPRGGCIRFFRQTKPCLRLDQFTASVTVVFPQ